MGADFFSPVGFPLPLQSPFLSASLIRPSPTKLMWKKKSDVKLVGGRGGLGERGRTATRGNHGSERLEWEMKIFAEFLRLS